MRTRSLLAVGCIAAFASFSPFAHTATYTDGGVTLNVQTNGQKTITWGRLPALDTNRFAVGTSAAALRTNAPVNQTNVLRDTQIYQWKTTNAQAQQFYSIWQTQMSSNDLLVANVLNRLAYGPTPDELERVRGIGGQAYIDEQLAAEGISNPPDTYYAGVQTNGVTWPPLPNTNWTTISVTGRISSSTLYIYMRAPGDMYIDNLHLSQLLSNAVINCTTNYVTNGTDIVTNTMCTTNYTNYLGPNVLADPGFENSLLAPSWTVSPNCIGSAPSTAHACEGSNGLHMVFTAGGTTQGSAIWQGGLTNNFTNGGRCVLTFSYLQSTNTHLLTVRLSGSLTIATGVDAPAPTEWFYVTQTGTASSSNLYIYLTGAGAGDLYVDDVKLVAGTVAESGQNLLRNGDFESPLNSTDWWMAPNMTNSSISSTFSHSGAGSLHVVASSAGSTFSSAIVQSNIAGMVANNAYTLSYWYTPTIDPLTVRLSGSGVNSTPDVSSPGIHRRLDAANWGVTLDEMRRWFCANGVTSQRQLLEILNQFFENHFVTYHSKTMDYFDQYYDGGILDRIATDLEYRENSRWRAALLNPNCTFYDLLKIHVESPAEIIYLDTVDSRGDGVNIANENYARELFELFTMGVDNGYEQQDIVADSRTWTGWTVQIVDRDQMDNPFAPQSQQYGNYPGDGYNAVSNLVGIWTFSYNTNWHGTNRAPILSVWDPNSPATNPVALGPKTYAPRFGPPWAGKPYQIVLPRRTGNAGIQDGYDVIASLSTNIHTAEYLSVKLCRIFVHDNFPNPTTKTNLAEYAFYTYTDPNRSAEAELIRQCIVAWDTPGPDGRKGNIRSVLRTIFNSDLFRGHAGSRQKVKTPLEFCLSAARACRSVNSSGIATATTDGNFSTPLSRMGSMSLFNRDTPDGYPETGPSWISAGTLAERLRFVQSLCTSTTDTVTNRPSDAGNGNTINPIALIQRKLPASSWTNAADVADLFITYFFFGEGKANLEQYRQTAIDFLNDGTADAGGATTRTFAQMTSFAADGSYDHRVRGMVSFLLTTQRFQEQ